MPNFRISLNQMEDRSTYFFPGWTEVHPRERSESLKANQDRTFEFRESATRQQKKGEMTLGDWTQASKEILGRS
jgi:hypothetical protein